jgi:hypothetical protein
MPGPGYGRAVASAKVFLGTTRQIDVCAGQQGPGIVAHEERPVGPVAQEGLIVEILVEQHVGHRKRQRAVAARADAEPAIGLLRQRVLAGIDNDQFRTAFHGPADPFRLGRFRHLRVHAPEQDGLRAVEIDPRRRRAIGELRSERAVPGTHMPGGEIVRAAEQAGQTLEPGAHVLGCRSRRGRAAEDDGLGPAFGFDC